MRKEFRLLLAMALASMSSLCAHGGNESPVIHRDTTFITDSTLILTNITWRYGVDTVAYYYGQELARLMHERRYAARTAAPTNIDAYNLRMTLPPTFYPSSILQQFYHSDAYHTTDVKIMGMNMVNDAFAKLYVNNPGVVRQMESQVKEAGTLRKDSHNPLTTNTKLTDKVVKVNIDQELNEDVELVTRKPNFWKFPGNGSLKFTQNYFSENWHKGGNNSYAMQGFLTLQANYDNKQKIVWENKLELQLGFQSTSKSDTHRSLKPTNNLMRLTTKFGHKAYKTLYYSTQVQFSTQMVNAYHDNSDVMYTAFLSPLDMTVSVGMDYKFETKNKKFSGSVYLAPCAYNMRYVKHDELVGRYGIEAGKHSYHKFGPNLTINSTWKIVKNVSWRSRLFWISNFSYTNIDWENTFDFTINKYLNATLFVNPKFDDSSASFKGEHGYLMLKEWFSLGFNYNW